MCYFTQNQEEQFAFKKNSLMVALLRAVTYRFLKADKFYFLVTEV